MNICSNQAKIAQLDQQHPISEEPIPEMTHRVYGLDREMIMNRLLACRQRSKDAWSSLKEASPVISYRGTRAKELEVDVGKQKQELAEFLRKRQILENKLRKQKYDSREWVEARKEDEEEAANEEYDDFEEEYYEEHDDRYYDDLAKIEEIYTSRLK